MGPRETSLGAGAVRRGGGIEEQGPAGSWDPDIDLQRAERVLTMVDYGAAPIAQDRMSEKTIQVVTLQASATGVAQTEIIDIVQDGNTWWVVETKGGRREAVVYTAPLKIAEHPLMRLVGEAEVVRVDGEE